MSTQHKTKRTTTPTTHSTKPAAVRTAQQWADVHQARRLKSVKWCNTVHKWMMRQQRKATTHAVHEAWGECIAALEMEMLWLGNPDNHAENQAALR